MHYSELRILKYLIPRKHSLFYISFIFSFNGFDNPHVFSSITDEDINYIEQDVRNELATRIEIAPHDFKYIYGDFAKAPELFKFENEEKEQIKKLVSSVNTTLKSVGIEYYQWNEVIAKRIKSSNKVGHFFKDEIYQKIDTSTQTETFNSHTHRFLNRLLENADRNANRTKEGFRYDKDIKEWATYFRILAGPIVYETVQRNLECALPALSSTNRYMNRANCHIVEGEIRVQELLQYLGERRLPLEVCLSEDATRISGRIQYDVRTNQIIGFVLPINDLNGMPIPYSYQARNADEICHHFFAKHSVANFANVVMAQPNTQNTAPFCLLFFGSDGKFSADHVIKRWTFISNTLRKHGITVRSFASDSDPRYNAAMRRISSLGAESDIFPNTKWFSMQSSPFLCFQDVIHILTKLRNLLLKTLKSKKLPFGPEYFISAQHIQYLLDNFEKDKHLLVQSTIQPADKQNFNSAKKITEPCVIRLIQQNVDEGKATAVFLQLMRNIIDAFMDKNLQPLCRVEKIWHSVFVLRIWREYILSHKIFTLKDNFITTNCYTCIEINAHSLILQLLALEKENSPQFFNLNLVDSQPCESFFRQVRSMTSTYSTVVNFSAKELLERLGRIQLQYDLSQNPHFTFPRIKKTLTSNSGHSTKLPSKKNIFDRVDKAKRNAIKLCSEFGLIGKNEKQTPLSKIKPFIPKKSSEHENTEESNSDFVPFEQNFDFRRVLLKNYSEKFIKETIDETSAFVELYKSIEHHVVVKKTALCWLLRKECYKLSSDRLLRVQAKQTLTKMKSFKIPLKTKKIQKIKRKKTRRIYLKKIIP